MKRKTIQEETTPKMTKREFIEELVDEVAKDWRSIRYLDDDEMYERFYRLKNEITYMANKDGKLTGFAIKINSYPLIRITCEPGYGLSITYRGEYGEIIKPLESWVDAWLCDRVLGNWWALKETIGHNVKHSKQLDIE